jgi:hypothetical protein
MQILNLTGLIQFPFPGTRFRKNHKLQDSSVSEANNSDQKHQVSRLRPLVAPTKSKVFSFFTSVNPM